MIFPELITDLILVPILSLFDSNGSLLVSVIPSEDAIRGVNVQ